MRCVLTGTQLPAAGSLPLVDTKATLLGILSSGSCEDTMLGVCWAGVRHLMHIPKQSPCCLSMGRCSVNSVCRRRAHPCFGEDHFVPAHASKRSAYQIVTNDWQPLWAQAGWGWRKRAGTEEVTEVRARFPQHNVGVKHSISPLLLASHAGGSVCSWLWPCRYGPQPFFWDMVTSDLHGPAFNPYWWGPRLFQWLLRRISKPKLSFDDHPVPLLSLPCPSGPADTQTYLA